MRFHLASLGCTACREAARWFVVRSAWVLSATLPSAVRAASTLRLVEEMYCVAGLVHFSPHCALSSCQALHVFALVCQARQGVWGALL